jgi:nucleolar GTP-binding protein
VLVDASETCGYQLDAQLALRDAIEARFEVPVLTVCNKADLSTAVEADAYTSVTADAAVAGKKSADAGRHVESLDSVLDQVIEAVGHEPELPFEG